MIDGISRLHKYGLQSVALISETSLCPRLLIRYLDDNSESLALEKGVSDEDILWLVELQVMQRYYLQRAQQRSLKLTRILDV